MTAIACIPLFISVAPRTRPSLPLRRPTEPAGGLIKSAIFNESWFMDQLKDLFLPLTLVNVSPTQLDLIIVQNWSYFFPFAFHFGAQWLNWIWDRHAANQRRGWSMWPPGRPTVGRAARM